LTNTPLRGPSRLSSRMPQPALALVLHDSVSVEYRSSLRRSYSWQVLHSSWARKLDIVEPAAGPWSLGAKLFAVRAARFAVYATKFPVPYVGNSSTQASLFNGYGEDTYAAYCFCGVTRRRLPCASKQTRVCSTCR